MHVLPTHAIIRETHTRSELVAIRGAVARADRVFAALKLWIVVRMSERMVAQKISQLFNQFGAEALSFPPIVAFGRNAANPHHTPTNRRLRNNEMVKLDFGCVYKPDPAAIRRVSGRVCCSSVGSADKCFYSPHPSGIAGRYDGLAVKKCSDMTRTLFFGTPDAKFKKMYSLVLRAQERAIARIRAGVACGVIDSVARGTIERAGFGKQFVHGTGHGISEFVHELPLLRPKSTDRLTAGQVITVEPGIYIKGWGGIRIEDMVLVQKNGSEVVTKSEKRLNSIVLE